MTTALRALILLPLSLFTLSCATVDVSSRGGVVEGEKPPARASFTLGEALVASHAYPGREEVKYVLERKLAFALSSSGVLRFHETGRPGDYVVAPELFLKSYEEKYEPQNYYLLYVEVKRGGTTVGIFSCEYNGPLSVFDARVMDALIEKLVESLEKELG